MKLNSFEKPIIVQVANNIVCKTKTSMSWISNIYDEYNTGASLNETAYTR